MLQTHPPLNYNLTTPSLPLKMDQNFSLYNGREKVIDQVTDGTAVITNDDFNPSFYHVQEETLITADRQTISPYKTYMI